MPNEVTNSFGVIEEQTVKGGGIPFFGPLQRANTGFSLEVFRGGQYQFTLEDGGESRRLRSGDVIYKVGKGPLTVEIDDSLATEDHYQKRFTAKIVLIIENGTQFAITYLNNADPVKAARDIIAGQIRKSAGRDSHDAITDLRLRAYIAQDVATLGDWGIRIASITDAQVFLDPRRQREIDAEIERKAKEAELQADLLIQERQRLLDIERRNAAIEDEDATKKAGRDGLIQDAYIKAQTDRIAAEAVLTTTQIEIQTKGLKTYAEVVIAAQTERLKVLLGQGYSLTDIRKDYPELFLGVAALALPSATLPELSAGPGTPATSTSDDPPLRNGVSRQSNQQGEHDISLLDIVIRATPLHPDQIQAGQEATNQGYLVLSVRPEGSGFGKIHNGMLLLTVDGVVIETVDLLTASLARAQAERREIELGVLYGDTRKTLKISLS